MVHAHHPDCECDRCLGLLGSRDEVCAKPAVALACCEITADGTLKGGYPVCEECVVHLDGDDTLVAWTSS